MLSMLLPNSESLRSKVTIFLQAVPFSESSSESCWGGGRKNSDYGLCRHFCTTRGGGGGREGRADGLAQACSGPSSPQQLLTTHCTCLSLAQAATQWKPRGRRQAAGAPSPAPPRQRPPRDRPPPSQKPSLLVAPLWLSAPQLSLHLGSAGKVFGQLQQGTPPPSSPPAHRTCCSFLQQGRVTSSSSEASSWLSRSAFFLRRACPLCMASFIPSSCFASCRTKQYPAPQNAMPPMAGQEPRGNTTEEESRVPAVIWLQGACSCCKVTWMPADFLLGDP